MDKQVVAVIGAGPAGLFAAKTLADKGIHVVILNRDIKPGGLAEYGIFHNKYKMKSGLRKQFKQILSSPLIDYYGNVAIGQNTSLTLDDIRQMGFAGILVTVGAQGTKWLGLPGEDLRGVYHAKDLVYHYNRLPPFSQQQYPIGDRVAIIGVGNVMLDIAHWTIRDLKVQEVIAVARRGPAEVKFTKKEMESVANNLDLLALNAEIARCRQRMEDVGQDVAQAKDFILSALNRAQEPVSDTRFTFQFFSSPKRIVGNEQGQVTGLEIEDTYLKEVDGSLKSRSFGTTCVIPVDTVVFAIGDSVDQNFGLPIEWNEFVKTSHPTFPIDDKSYEVEDTLTKTPMKGIFVAGWARAASDGLVGAARKDGTNGAEALLQYLATGVTASPEVFTNLKQKLNQYSQPVINKTDLQKLEAIEEAEAQRQNLAEFKFSSNEDMLKVVGSN